MSVTMAEELVTKPVTDIGSAIGDVPGVDIGLTKMGNSTISIRSFDSDYTLIMVDGRRQNVSGAMTMEKCPTLQLAIACVMSKRWARKPVTPMTTLPNMMPMSGTSMTSAGRPRACR